MVLIIFLFIIVQYFKNENIIRQKDQIIKQYNGFRVRMRKNYKLNRSCQRLKIISKCF